MKILCGCGERILDQTDGLRDKAHFFADQDWESLMDSIDAAIEKSGPSPQEKERACMDIRSLIVRLGRLGYQCSACGSLYLTNRKKDLERFTAETATEAPLFASDEKPKH
jgi:predicted SprT family Zn-dependent metalloprotease